VMTEEAFWEIIEAAKGSPERVETALRKLKPDEIDAWDRIFWEKHNALHRWDLWAAGQAINGGMTDDGFHYFKSWIVGKGRAAFETAIRSPDDLGDHITPRDEQVGCDNELLNYAASQAYEDLAQMELDYRSNEFDEPAGEQWTEEEAKQRLPKLWQRFG
jgi:hypothetical protein